ncbi:MAG: LysE family transporter [bacterium]
MEITFALEGILIGFAMAVPIGPIGIMCISKTLTESRLRGFIVGLGAATADLLYSCVAAFGLTFIADTLTSHRIWIRLIGGILLLLLGAKTYSAKPVNPKIKVYNNGTLGLYFYVVFLTLTNPLTIFVFIAVFAELGLGNNLSFLSASLLVTGIFVGSFLWFLTLISGATFFRKKMDMFGLKWVNRIAGVFIIISGFYALISLL